MFQFQSPSISLNHIIDFLTFLLKFNTKIFTIEMFFWLESPVLVIIPACHKKEIDFGGWYSLKTVWNQAGSKEEREMCQ